MNLLWGTIKNSFHTDDCHALSGLMRVCVLMSCNFVCFNEKLRIKKKLNLKNNGHLSRG